MNKKIVHHARGAIVAEKET